MQKMAHTWNLPFRVPKSVPFVPKEKTYQKANILHIWKIQLWKIQTVHPDRVFCWMTFFTKLDIFLEAPSFLEDIIFFGLSLHHSPHIHVKSKHIEAEFYLSASVATENGSKTFRLQFDSASEN